jgi:hypothetical protein
MLDAMEAPSTSAEPEVMPAEPRDWMPWLLGIGTFTISTLAMLAFARAGFRISPTVTRAAPWVVLATVVVALKVTVPNSRLTPQRRLRRERRTDGALIGFLSALLVLGTVWAAFYLRSWTDWLILGNFFLVTIGVGLMLRARFTIGPG